MSIQFSNTDNFKGLVQLYEEEIGVEPGYISGNVERLKRFTARVNLAQDSYFAIAVRANGAWQLDDSNHGKYPFIETDLVENQRDVTVLTDQEGNNILDVYKVMVRGASGVYAELNPIDQQARGEGLSIWDGQNITGVPTEYDKTANGIIFNVLPNYSWRQAVEGQKGIKVFINRESDYFVHTDTDKKPGYPYHQEYFFLKPALEHARRNSLSTLPRLEKVILDLEGDVTTGRVGLIAKAYGNRQRDVDTYISGEIINSI